MNRIQELSRQIARGQLVLPPEPPLGRGRPQRPRPGPQPSSRPSRNSATLAPIDSTA